MQWVSELYIFAYFICIFSINYHQIYLLLFGRPYDNRWSKTMIGYGPESTHFVLELTYNYGVKVYEMGMV